MSLCESCIKGKITRQLFKAKGHRVFECLKLMHTNVYGPFNVRACGEYEYFVTFTNRNSRYGYIYLMIMKFVALDKFKEFKVNQRSN